MHEFSVMQGVVATILEKLREHEFERVKEVNLVIGELTFLAVEQLKFAFTVLSEGTSLQGAKLNIRVVPAQVRCENCGYAGPLRLMSDEAHHYFLPLFLCPNCSSAIEIVRGKECLVENVVLVGDKDETRTDKG